MTVISVGLLSTPKTTKTTGNQAKLKQPKKMLNYGCRNVTQDDAEGNLF